MRLRTLLLAALACIATFAAAPTASASTLDDAAIACVDDDSSDMATPHASSARQSQHRVVWKPNPGPQTRFLALGCYEALYGGAAGGGKSDALLAGALRHVDKPRYKAIIFRRTYPELERSIIERSRQIIPAAFPGVKYNEQKHAWRFPSGALLFFGHLEHEHSVMDHQGAEYQYIGFDELTHFTESQYRYMLSRGRSVDGIPVRIRGATNPGGSGHEWVFKRWAPWLDPESQVKANPGEVLYFINTPDGERFVEKGTLDHEGLPAQGRVFVPALLEDNPKGDPTYAAKLANLDPVRREQLRNGNWLIKPAKGLYFKRGWFKFVDAPPAEVVARVRYWDLAGSPDGDWAVGVKMSKAAGGIYTIEDVMRLRGTPGDVRAAVMSTAELDGRDVPVVIEQDPGQAGKDQVASYVRDLAGWTVRGKPKRVDKVTAAGPFSSQVQAGNVRLVRNQVWNEPYISELESFPEGEHDDQVDASSGAFGEVAAPPVAESAYDIEALIG